MRRLLWGMEMRKGRMLNRNIIQEVQYSLMRCKFCNSISVVRYGLTDKVQPFFYVLGFLNRSKLSLLYSLNCNEK